VEIHFRICGWDMDAQCRRAWRRFLWHSNSCCIEWAIITKADARSRREVIRPRPGPRRAGNDADSLRTVDSGVIDRREEYRGIHPGRTRQEACVALIGAQRSRVLVSRL